MRVRARSQGHGPVKRLERDTSVLTHRERPDGREIGPARDVTVLLSPNVLFRIEGDPAAGEDVRALDDQASPCVFWRRQDSAACSLF